MRAPPPRQPSPTHFIEHPPPHSTLCPDGHTLFCLYTCWARIACRTRVGDRHLRGCGNLGRQLPWQDQEMAYARRKDPVRYGRLQGLAGIVQMQAQLQAQTCNPRNLRWSGMKIQRTPTVQTPNRTAIDGTADTRALRKSKVSTRYALARC